MFHFSFRLWLEDQEEYERLFSSRAKEAFYKSKDYFSKWFPEHLRRTYIPLKQNRSFSQYFRSNDFIAPEDDEIIKGLAQLGYEVIDYRAGYVKRGQGKEKLGGVLSRLIATTKEEDKKQLYSKWLKQFSISGSRSGKNLTNNLWVIISRNPHDIAQMSYDRDWLSCMELKDGQYKGAPFCVIKSGGMVAYLLNKSEAEVKQLVISEWEPIEKPLARISIKAAKNVKDPSIVIAIPEETVYGANISGFWETVKGWLEERQGDVGSGRFRVLGGYTDTFGDASNRSFQRPPTNEEELLKWIDSNVGGRSDAAVNYILNNHTKIKSQEIWDKLKKYFNLKFDNHYDLSPNEEKLFYLITIKPHMFSDEELNAFPFNVRERLNRIGKEDRLVHGLLKSHKGKLRTLHGSELSVVKAMDEHDLARIENLMATGNHGSINQVSATRLFRFLADHLDAIKMFQRGVFGGSSTKIAEIVHQLEQQFARLAKSILKLDLTGKNQSLYHLANFVIMALKSDYLPNEKSEHIDLKKFPGLENDLVKALAKVPPIEFSSWDMEIIGKLLRGGLSSSENTTILRNVHDNLMRRYGKTA